MPDVSLDEVLPITRLEETGSTNAEARAAVEAGRMAGRGGLWVARRQTAGVGQWGRRWVSPEGGLWCTLAWRCGDDPRHVLAGLGVRVGVACAATVEEVLAGAGATAMVQMKWPNDVLVAGAKVCGCLSQSLATGGETVLIIGVGINVNNPMADVEVQGRATSLAEIAGGEVALEVVLQALRRHLHRAVTAGGLEGEWLDEARRMMAPEGGAALVRDGAGVVRRGRLVGLTSDGWPEFEAPEGSGERFRGGAGASVQ